jgi:UDP-N-acetylglucosamine 4-epimerase
MNASETLLGSSVADVLSEPRRWLVTGCAGFIGSSLVEALLANGQAVVGLDDFSTGNHGNLAQIKRKVGEQRFQAFRLIEGDIRDAEAVARACDGVDIVLHHAAIASVPVSIEQPLHVHDVNVTGTLMLLEAARQADVRRLIYASSSAVYGDCTNEIQIESAIGNSLSPYAATKRMNEIYGRLHTDIYGLETVGLRYFNIYGPRQDPSGPYSAVIPLWVASMIGDRPVTINGSDEISRDFCFIEDVVQANIRAALTKSAVAGDVFNIASGKAVTLRELFEAIQVALREVGHDYQRSPVMGPPRLGDITRSSADIEKARAALGFEPTHDLADGLVTTVDYMRHQGSSD